jgi:hypothetical protein
MKESQETLPASKADGKEIKSYFEKVYPDMDFERVYGSDMKKMIKWFEILNNNNIEIKLSESREEDSADHITGKKSNSSKTITPKSATVRNAPAKKINSPRKMA